ncbi:hypothetical protein [Novosphingobium sp.]|jgi:hypothetical protein|uniref:hypothetical protein n=1 Tax=Novosphingobium sp. TaxID=1874826 RepID=UPI0025D20575|nr:hypothetical protein [Novosphingobium sp.]HNN56520.1 hypothetical protein [Novosphingobium sp.]
MKSQVFKRCPDVAHFADVSLSQGVLDLTTGVPDGEEGCWPVTLSASKLSGANAWQVRNPAQCTENIGSITTGMAGHEDAAIALPDRQ